jgi:hypothetical protein
MTPTWQRSVRSAYFVPLHTRWGSAPHSPCRLQEPRRAFGNGWRWKGGSKVGGWK